MTCWWTAGSWPGSWPTSRAELPVDTATSLALERAPGERQQLLCAVLGEIERLYLAWAGGASPGDPDACGLRAEYRRQCATLGWRVRVEFPGGDATSGTALDVDADGRLVVRTADGPRAVSAGDVVHLRGGVGGVRRWRRALAVRVASGERRR